MFTKHKFARSAPVVSEPYDPRMFQPITQTTTVTVTIQEKDDGIAECISGCFRMCFGAAKAAAK